MALGQSAKNMLKAFSELLDQTLSSIISNVCGLDCVNLCLVYLYHNPSALVPHALPLPTLPPSSPPSAHLWLLFLLLLSPPALLLYLPASPTATGLTISPGSSSSPPHPPTTVHQACVFRPCCAAAKPAPSRNQFHTLPGHITLQVFCQDGIERFSYSCQEVIGWRKVGVETTSNQVANV